MDVTQQFYIFCWCWQIHTHFPFQIHFIEDDDATMPEPMSMMMCCVSFRLTWIRRLIGVNWKSCVHCLRWWHRLSSYVKIFIPLFALNRIRSAVPVMDSVTFFIPMNCTHTQNRFTSIRLARCSGEPSSICIICRRRRCAVVCTWLYCFHFWMDFCSRK